MTFGAFSYGFGFKQVLRSVDLETKCFVEAGAGYMQETGFGAR